MQRMWVALQYSYIIMNEKLTGQGESIHIIDQIHKAQYKNHNPFPQRHIPDSPFVFGVITIVGSFGGPD